MIRPPRRALAAAVLLLALASPAAAQTWTGASSNVWNVASNWSSPAGQRSRHPARLRGDAQPRSVNSIPGTFVLNRMTFNAGSPAYSFTGNPLDFRFSSVGTAPDRRRTRPTR